MQLTGIFHSMRFTMIATYFAVALITMSLMCVYVIGLLSEKLHSSEQTDMFAKANIIAQVLSENWDSDGKDLRSFSSRQNSVLPEQIRAELW